MNKEKKCRYSMKINAYLDGELNRKQHDIVKMHLTNCSLCQKELREIISVNAFLGDYHEVELSEDFADRIFSELPVQKIYGISLTRTIRKFTIAASLILSLVSGIFLSADFYENSHLTQQEDVTIELAAQSLYSYLDTEE